jgi:hypothetical protein
MSVRPPRILARRRDDNPLQGLEHELLEEKAATLSRLGRRLEQALERLAAFEAEGSGPHRTAGERERLLGEAGEALWHLVIQREAMGLRNTEQALRAYKVPQAVRLRMGAAPRAGRRR